MNDIKKIKIKWGEIYSRLNKILNKYPKDTRYYGIPRGGQVIAGLTRNAEIDIKNADVIIDDVYDSGDTARKYEKYNLPMEFLFDKREEPNLPWIIFPWEQQFDRGFESDIVRILERIGEDPKREGIQDTPKRVVKAWKELTTPIEFNATVFDSNGYDQMIVERSINYYTFCEHHMLPFFGQVAIGYIPDDKIIGISKLPRTVEYFSKMLNTQEYFTNNIANFLFDKLKPQGLGVIVSGRHLCQEMRGVKKIGETITSCLKGAMLEDPKAKKEFFYICQKNQ